MSRPAPVEPSRRSLPLLLRDAAATLLHFLHGQALIALILIGFHTLGFHFAAVPLWWFSGPLIGALTLIPFLGFLIGAVLGVAITLLAGGDHWAVIGLLAVMTAGQFLEAFYLTPKILGRRLKLPPALVFVVVLLGAIVFGPLGVWPLPPPPSPCWYGAMCATGTRRPHEV